jgi:hypothetical protein
MTQENKVALERAAPETTRLIRLFIREAETVPTALENLLNTGTYLGVEIGISKLFREYAENLTKVKTEL